MWSKVNMKSEISKLVNRANLWHKVVLPRLISLLLYFGANFYLANCVCKCKHYPHNTVLGISGKISTVMLGRWERRMLQGGSLCVVQKEVGCVSVCTHTHFSTFRNLAAKVCGHPSFRWIAVSVPPFCSSWCLPSLTLRWDHTINRGQSPISSINQWCLLFDITIKCGATVGLGSLKLF